MQFYGTTLSSRLFLGTAQYPSPKVLCEAIAASGCEVITLSLRRETSDGAGTGFWQMLRQTGARILPNTAGCHSVQEAVTTAQMAREIFDTDWIKLEVIGHADMYSSCCCRHAAAIASYCRDCCMAALFESIFQKKRNDTWSTHKNVLCAAGT